MLSQEPQTSQSAVSSSPQVPVSRNRWSWLIGALGIVALAAGGSLYALRYLPSFFPVSTEETDATAYFVQYQGGQEAVLIAADSSGEKKELARIPTVQPERFIPKVLVDKEAFYYLGGHNTLVRKNFGTGEIVNLPPANLYEASRIRDFSVEDSVAVVLEQGSLWENRNPPSSGCSLWIVDTTSRSEVVAFDIDVCEQAHGPHYSLGEVADGKVTLFEQYGEAGFAMIKRHEFDLTSKTDVIAEEVSFDPRCERGEFYDEITCTEEARRNNVAYRTFESMHRLGYGWSTQCGDMFIRKDEEEFYTLYVNDARVFTDVEYAGCVIR